MSFEGYVIPGELPTPTPIVPTQDGEGDREKTKEKQSWTQLRQAVRDVRRKLSNLSTKVPSSFTFRTVQTTDGTLLTRVYFLSAMSNGRETTLLYTDIPEEITTQSNEMFTNIPPLVLPWNPLLESTFQVLPSMGKVSKEEQLQWERKRLVTWGITSYEVHHDSGCFVFPACSSLFMCEDGINTSSTPYFPSELKTTCTGVRLNPQVCPSNPKLVACVCNSDIWVQHIGSGSEKRLTFAHKGSKSLANDPLSAGIPAYVTQEEFNRYMGFWWQPRKSQSDNVYRMLYEEVDESEVEILHFVSHNTEERGVEEYRFPRAGTPNAKSTLKMLEFVVDENEQIGEVRHLHMLDSLYEMFPWLEYIVRIGWLPDGKRVWAELLNRRQQHLELILIPMEFFVPLEQIFDIPMTTTKVDSSSSTSVNNAGSPASSPPFIHVLITEDTDVWLNIHDILHFFPQTDESSLSFIWASEKTGFRHFYLVTCDLTSFQPPPLPPSSETSPSNEQQDESMEALDIIDSLEGRVKPCSYKETQLTSGNWEVLDKEFWVDVQRKLIYFLGCMDSPLEKHLYVVSLNAPRQIRRLTELGYSHSIAFNKECTLFTDVYSSLKSVPASQVFRVVFANSSPTNSATATAAAHNNNECDDEVYSVDNIRVDSVGFLLEPSGLDDSYQHPELFSCKISSGDTIYGLIFEPRDMDYTKKYPTVLSIYGGPEVQLVTNTFKGLRQLRLHMLSDQGYVVVLIDSRGSRHRGLVFESHLKDRMGTVEISDQVEVIEWLGRSVSYIDLNRIAVHGWSYGGYLSLMAIAQRPDIFKIAVAGAPVTSWALYDTGYTERYMDRPDVNEQGYKSGSVLSYVNLFPSEQNRLLIIHGLIDENVHFSHTSQLIHALVRAGKPYQLQIYPNERHSLRHLEASEHYETTLLSFLQTWL